MKVLVTGANGLLATNTILHLLECGYEVKGLLRDRRKFLLNTPEIELTEGDIRDKEAVEEAVQTCGYVVHIAALTSQNEPNYNKYYDINVEGTSVILNAAIKYNLKKFIFISSANTIGYGSLTQPGVEGMPVRQPFSNSLYAKSKIEAEQRVLAASEKIDVVVLNPSFLLGPYDSKPSSGRIIFMANRSFIFYPPGGKNFVNATDVAKGISASIAKDLNKEIFLMTGENLSYRSFFERTTRVLGNKPVYIKIPSWLLVSIGYAGDVLRMFGVQTSIASTHMKILCIENYYSNNRATKKLKIQFEPIEKGINSAVKWFKAKDMLK